MVLYWKPVKKASEKEVNGERMRIRGLVCLFFIISLSFGCYPGFQKPAGELEGVALRLVPESDWPDLEDDLAGEHLQSALEQSLSYLSSRGAGYKMRLGDREITAQDVQDSLVLFSRLSQEYRSQEDLRAKLKQYFHLYQLGVRDQATPLLITGYYEPVLMGSRSPSLRFAYPVYREPDDLLVIDPGLFSKKIQGQKLIGRLRGKQVIPYYSRREIDRQGVLRDKDLEILWVDDPLKLFFLHIQGSGEVILEGGAALKLQYQSSNGQAYVPIGKELIKRGVLKPEEVSLQSIYAYLKEHPEIQDEILDLNPSYIFFREALNGPSGSLGFPLTAGRSLAMDLSLVPPGCLAWLEGVKPVFTHQGQISWWQPLSRWVSIQDSGGAIKGPGRADLFWGKGPEAEMAAGHLKHLGKIYFLIKK
jgi:peptidoglycan lytic transglycosylase A